MVAIKMNANADEALSQRMHEALDNAPGVPVRQHGRLTWIKRQLEERYGHVVQVETVRRWMAGTAMPTTDSLEILAKLFGVEPAWLAMGDGPARTRRQAERLVIAATGAVGLALGFLQATGVSATHETENGADILAIIQGRRQYFQVGLLDPASMTVEFRAPYPAGDLMVVEIIGATAKIWILARTTVDEDELSRPGSLKIQLQTVRNELRMMDGTSLRPAVDLTIA